MRTATRTILRLGGMLGMGTLLATGVHAQEFEDGDLANPMGVVVDVRGGVVLSTARGAFPSLIIVESQGSGEIRGSGEVPESYAESGQGSRFGIAAMIPVSSRFGVDLEVGTLRYAALYKGDATRLPTRFDVQTLQLVIGAEGSIYSDPLSFERGGLRSVYAGAGLDITLATLANRVESMSYRDTVSPPVVAVGTFDNTEPFSTLTALRGVVGIRFAATPHLELLTEASYSYALNKVFSSSSVPGTTFTIDNMGIMLGIGYRF